jgi:hypothetical protein
VGQVSDLPYQAGWELLGVLTSLFSVPFERERLLRPKFLAGLQIEGAAPNFFDEDFSQLSIHLLRRYPNDSGGRALFRGLVELPEQLGKINLPDQWSRQDQGLHLPDA